MNLPALKRQTDEYKVVLLFKCCIRQNEIDIVYLYIGSFNGMTTTVGGFMNTLLFKISSVVA